MKKVLFVCTGNTCRSPMAEGIFKKMFPKMTVSSAGIFADGSPYCDKSVTALKEIGIDIDGFSKPITKEDTDADLIFCMSGSHRDMLISAGVDGEKIKVLGVSDPFGGDLAVYRRCRDEIIEKLSVYDFKVVPALREDVAQIAEIEAACFSAPWSENAIMESMESGSLFWVAKANGTVLGYGGLQPVLDEGYILNVATLPEFRGFGVAEEVVSAICDYCVKGNFSFVTLEVRKSNIPAISLYEKAGFTAAGERKNFYGNPREDAIIMTKVIKSEDTEH